MIKLAPSILAADFNTLGEQINIVEKEGADYLHIDVMDGNFVPSISFGMPVIESIRKKTNLPFDVHLMLEEPIRHINDFHEVGANIITVHAEACRHLHKTIHLIKSLGMKAGVVLNPSTPLSVLDYILDDVDMVLLMCVNPGFGGQTFIPGSIRKIKELREMIEQRGGKIDLEVDGGISPSNVAEIIQAGANVIVAGTTIFEGDIVENVREYKRIFSTISK